MPGIIPLSNATLPIDNQVIKMEVISNTVPKDISNIHFFNASTGIAITFYSQIFKTEDAGKTWTEIQLNDLYPIYCTHFYTLRSGYAVSGSKLITVQVT